MGRPGCKTHTLGQAHFLSCQNLLSVVKVACPAWIIGICVTPDLCVPDDYDAMRVEQLVDVLLAFFPNSSGEYPRLSPA
jgi:hypothetical protein